MKTEHKIKSSLMKNIALLMLLFTAIVKAQIVNIPDANFKTFLLNAGLNAYAYNQANFAVPIDTNGDGEIQNTEAQVIYKLVIDNRNMQNMTGITAFSNLTTLEIRNNTQLTTVDLTGMSSLITVKLFANTLLNSFNVSGLVNLKTLQCNIHLNLFALDLTDLVSLEQLSCYSNRFSDLNFMNLPSLFSLDCGGNSLTTIDVSNCPLISTLSCEGSPLLTTIFMKNGSNENTGFAGCPNLNFICADESQIAEILLDFALIDITNVEVNSYCSFNPGGDFNTITGNVKFDSNNNGCDAADNAIANLRMNLTGGPVQNAVFSTASGNYNCYVLAGSYDVAPEVENPTWFNFSPANSNFNFVDNNNNLVVQDFCISGNGVHPDLEIVLAPTSSARPGFDSSYQLVYKNKGTEALSGNITFTFNDAVLNYLSSTIAPDAQSSGLLNWNFSNLQPFENRSFSITLHVNAPTDVPAVNVGDVLPFEATITPVIGDEIPQDNLFTFNETVVGSFDPNNIICLEGTSVAPSEIGNYLHYMVNFENTGTAPAANIVVKTEIDPAQFNINSLQLMNASHAVDARITGNKVEFIFNGIDLDIGGHGHILLKIKSNETLVSGGMVSKRADIFFDYNAPIDTGFYNTVFQTLSSTTFAADDSIMIFPNPVVDALTVKADSSIQSIELFDAQGRIIRTSLVNARETRLNLSAFSKGMYLIKIQTAQGSKTQKLLKE